MLIGRAYFAAQAFAGALWWVAVATIPAVRIATLGELDPLPIAVLDIPLFVLASAAAAAGSRAAAAIAASWTALVTIALAAYATVSTEAGWGVVAMAAAAGCSVLALLLVLLGRIPTEWIVTGPFAVRTASRQVTTVAHMRHTAAQIIVFWGFFLVVVPLGIAALEQRWRLALRFPPGVGAGIVATGVVVLVAASALGIAAAVVMSRDGAGTPLPAATANDLVIAGPYRIIRNPMAVSGIAQGVAVGMILSSWMVVAYALVGSAIWNWAVRPLEEADLEARFGDPYRRYRDAVRCWVPRAAPALVDASR